MGQKAACHRQILSHPGEHETSFVKQKIPVILLDQIDIAAGLSWRGSGDDVGFAQMPEHQRHGCLIAAVMRNSLPASFEKRGYQPFVELLWRNTPCLHPPA